MPNQSSDTLTTAIGVILIIFALAFLVPILILSLQTPETQTFIQSEDETVFLTQGLTGTLDTVSNNQNEVNVTLIDQDTGEVAATGSLTDNTTVTIGGENVSVMLIEKLSNSDATIRYIYPLYYGWSDEAKTVFDNIVIIIMLVTLLFISGSILVMVGVFE